MILSLHLFEFYTNCSVVDWVDWHYFQQVL